MEDIKKALETIALKNSEGIVPDDLLIKACDAYKIKSDGFLDDYDYHVCVAKSLYDHLNGIEPDEEICKAVVPGQTKVVDGVMYIWAATPNAKTDYDWRVFKGRGKKIGRQVTDDKAIKSKQDYVNDLFPSDLKTLKVVKQLGGSTGAVLVEDSRGHQYVMKKGSNTNNDHVKSEYLANQLYDLLGQRVPDYELYDDNGDAVLLSKFIPLTRMPTANDYAEMAKGFVADAMLANWDVYQNDNCLIDHNGRVIRVDNGGSLNYRAQGSTKSFGSGLSDFDSMKKYNPSVISHLTEEDFISQINDVLSKKDDLLNFLEESKHDNLKATFEGRFQTLEKIKKDYEARVAIKNKKVPPRKLKSKTEMYRAFDNEELDDFWKNAASPNKDYHGKLMYNGGGSGWDMLSEICKARGFDARPRVVSRDEYQKIVDKSEYQMFRGLANDRRTALEYSDDFKYNDKCFYGSIGVYGEGIYFHVNDGNGSTKDKDKYKNSPAYGHARNYAGHNGEILEAALEPNAKVILLSDLMKEINSTVAYDTAEAREKMEEIKDINDEIKKKETEIDNVSYSIEKKVKTDMHWNSSVLNTFQKDIDSVDWGAIDEHGDPKYPSYDEFVKGKVFDWVKKNGGDVISKDKNEEVVILRLPNSKNDFMLTKHQWDNNAIKRKNAFATPYNYPLKRFENWLLEEHYSKIKKEINKEMEKTGDIYKQLKSELSDLNSELTLKKKELEDVKSVKDPNKDILSGIYASTQRGYKEAAGVYAALKGYDAIIQPHGNGSSNSFAIVLNRSKVVVCK